MFPMETIFKSEKTDPSKVSKIWQVEVLPFVPVISIFILLFIFKNSSMSEEILILCLEARDKALC